MTSREDLQTAGVLINYLAVLQQGKNRPNIKGPGTIQDAKDNLGDIAAVKLRLAEIFDLEKIEYGD